MNEEKDTAEVTETVAEDIESEDIESEQTDLEDTAPEGAEDTDVSAPAAGGVGVGARVALCALALVVTLAVAGYAALLLALRGPSDTHRENTVVYLQGNPVGRVLLSTVMSESEVAECIGAKTAREAIESAEAGVFSVEINSSCPTLGEIDRGEGKPDDGSDGAVVIDDDGIEVIKIKTESYKGTLMIVDDPTRIFVGTPEKYGTTAYGLKLRDMIRKYDAVAGINAGGFIVYGDTQTGGYPMGFVISDSKIIWEEQKGASDNICGFDANGKLIVGTMSPQQAINAGVVNAVSFGPALIIDGKPVNTGHWLGLERNARTAIGQREDGAVLLLVIEGRHIASFGAYFTDVIDVMLEYGAVNATNLDGGYSTFMVYDGSEVDMRSYAYGERYLPTSILVRAK